MCASKAHVQSSIACGAAGRAARAMSVRIVPELIKTSGLSSMTRRAAEHGDLLERDAFPRRDL